MLHQEIEFSIDAVRAKQSRNLPTVLTQDEAVAVIHQLSGVHQIVAKLLYGSDLRLMEALRLRVKDLDFAQHQIIVRDGKGGNSRITMLPTSVVDGLKDHIQRVQRQHQHDLDRGYGSVYLSNALERGFFAACDALQEIDSSVTDLKRIASTFDGRIVQLEHSAGSLALTKFYAWYSRF